MEELEFRKVPSLENLYEVSEDGKSLRNVKSGKYSKVFVDYHHSKAGYYMSFVNIRKSVQRVIMHKIVSECWLGIKPVGFEIDHKDRNTLNNHYTNLRYVTHSEQMKNRVLSNKVLDAARKNCKNWVAQISIPVMVKKESNAMEFDSITQASNYIAQQIGVKSESIRHKMKKRCPVIEGYTIYYKEKKKEIE